MNIKKLLDELVSDPLGRSYAGMTDRQVVTSLNTKDRNVHSGEFVDTWKIERILDGVLAQKAAWRSSIDPTIKAFWDDYRLKLTANQPTKIADPDEDARWKTLGPAPGAAIISNATLTKILNIDLDTISRAEELKLGEEVHGEHVDKARRLGGLR